MEGGVEGGGGYVRGRVKAEFVVRVAGGLEEGDEREAG